MFQWGKEGKDPIRTMLFKQTLTICCLKPISIDVAKENIFMIRSNKDVNNDAKAD